MEPFDGPEVLDDHVMDVALVPCEGVAPAPSAGVRVLQERVFYIGLTQQEAGCEFVCFACCEPW